MTAVDLVYNPVSGSFSQAHCEALREALKEEGFSVTMMPTTAEGAQLSGAAQLVCVHGGDGTLRDTVHALGDAAADVPLAVAPSGTINLVARELGYLREPRQFARQVAAAWAKGRDAFVEAPLYRLGEMPIVSCLSIGPDSHAVARVSGKLKQRIGRYAYVVAMVQQMREWPRNKMIVRGELVTGEDFCCEAEAAIVSSAALYAGPFRLSPEAALDADAVELITLERSTRLGTMLLSLAVMLRLPVDRFAKAQIRTCRRIEFDRCVTPVQVDGDHMPDCGYAIGPSGLSLRYVV
jgi:diacylglycerol kinase family enzyme